MTYLKAVRAAHANKLQSVYNDVLPKDANLRVAFWKCIAGFTTRTKRRGSKLKCQAYGKRKLRDVCAYDVYRDEEYDLQPADIDMQENGDGSKQVGQHCRKLRRRTSRKGLSKRRRPKNALGACPSASSARAVRSRVTVRMQDVP